MKLDQICRRLQLMTVLCASASAGCAASGTSQALESTPRQLFERAIEASNAGDYSAAVALFREVEEYGRYSELAQNALLQIVYANFRAQDWEATIGAAAEFEALYPHHPKVEYCVYMKALAYWDRAQLTHAESTRHVFEAYALQSLRDLVRRFPTSDYGADARRRIEYLGGSQPMLPEIIDPPQTLELGPMIVATSLN